MAAIRKSIEEEAPALDANPASRSVQIALGRLYDLLVSCAARCGHSAEARTALQEREKLRGDEVNELKDIAQDYLRLADAITRHGNNPGPAEHAEWQHCLDEAHGSGAARTNCNGSEETTQQTEREVQGGRDEATWSRSLPQKGERVRLPLNPKGATHSHIRT